MEEVTLQPPMMIWKLSSGKFEDMYRLDVKDCQRASLASWSAITFNCCSKVSDSHGTFLSWLPYMCLHTIWKLKLDNISQKHRIRSPWDCASLRDRCQSLPSMTTPMLSHAKTKGWALRDRRENAAFKISAARRPPRSSPW